MHMQTCVYDEFCYENNKLLCFLDGASDIDEVSDTVRAAVL